MNNENNTEKDKRLSYLFRKCGRATYFHSNFGVRQTEILRRLREEGPMTQKELQEKMGIQPATISELVSKLEDKELVCRERSESDRRVVVLSLTEQGARSADKRIKDNLGTTVGIPLTDEEMDILLGLLEKMNAAYEAQDKERR